MAKQTRTPQPPTHECCTICGRAWPIGQYPECPLFRDTLHRAKRANDRMLDLKLITVGAVDPVYRVDDWGPREAMVPPLPPAPTPPEPEPEPEPHDA